MEKTLRVGIAVASPLIGQLMAEYLAESCRHDSFVSHDSLDDVASAPRPDVVVVSAALLTRALGRWPDVPVLVWCKRRSTSVMAESLDTGAAGVVDGDATLHELAQAIETVASGQAWLPQAHVADILLQLSLARRDQEREALSSLTSREREVMLLIGQGLTRHQIGERLFVSSHTVRTHVQNILGKLDVHSQVAIAAFARRAVDAGWVEREPETLVAATTA